MRRAGLLAAGMAAAFVLAACGGDEDPVAESEEPDATEEPEGDAGPEPADLRLWVNGGDTPQEMRDWLVETFEAQNPGSTL
ncbi:MAG TPA: hypothetical protein VFZ72_13355, partial [Jiangellaceae bacterium]